MKKIISILFLLLLCNYIFADINDELIEAVREGDSEKVQQLIEQGADVNAMAKKKYGRTALSFAARGGHIKIVKLLLQAGADVNAHNKDGETALDIAREKGHNAIIQILLQAGAEE